MRPMRLPVSTDDVDKVGKILILAYEDLVKEAARNGRLAADGTFSVVEQSTVEFIFNLEIVLIVYKSCSTGKTQYCGRAVLSLRTTESCLYMFHNFFSLLRDHGLLLPLETPTVDSDDTGAEPHASLSNVRLEGMSTDCEISYVSVRQRVRATLGRPNPSAKEILVLSVRSKNVTGLPALGSRLDGV